MRMSGQQTAVPPMSTGGCWVSVTAEPAVFGFYFFWLPPEVRSHETGLMKLNSHVGNKALRHFLGDHGDILKFSSWTTRGRRFRAHVAMVRALDSSLNTDSQWVGSTRWPPFTGVKPSPLCWTFCSCSVVMTCATWGTEDGLNSRPLQSRCLEAANNTHLLNRIMWVAP